MDADGDVIGGGVIGDEIAEAVVQPERSDAQIHGDADCDGFGDRNPADLSHEDLVEDIRRNISCIAHCHARVIALIDEVDRRGLWAQWVGVTSLSNWVMHIAAVSAHTAREYVRVMTALREMPRVQESLRAGDVSYSKVREVTRLAGRIPDADALRLAQEATGSQIGVIARNYRQLSAAQEDEQLPRFLPSDSVSFRCTEPGRTRITIDVAEDDAAEFFTMLEAARQVLEQRSEEEGAKRPDGEAAGEAPREPISQVMCLMEIVHAFPRAVPPGSMDCDRARMLIHASAEMVTQSPGMMQTPGTVRSTAEVVPRSEGEPDGVPAGTPSRDAAEEGSEATPAAPMGETDATCRIEGFGGITAATAQRLSCEALMSAVVKGEAGEVLALGRSRRLVSRRQRRALSARDIGCQFPGCRTRRRCDAHHIRPWSQGGTTDLDNLILLCRAHHTAVHEHGLTIRRTAAPFAGKLQGGTAFAFFTPDGSELLPLRDGRRGRQVFDSARLVKTVREAMIEADPRTRGGGWGFDLANCLAWMFEAEWRHARESEIAA